MKLNYEGRCELRKQVRYLLEKVPYGQRIELDEEILEQLLFEKKQMVPDHCFKNKEQFFKNGFAKLPVWSGPFLRKLDLSKVSFENVTWSISDYKDHFEEVKAIYNFNGDVDYSYTNARIDFSLSFESKDDFHHDGKCIIIKNCNFAGVDLSNNDIVSAVIFNSDISHTNLNLENSEIICSNSNFTDINLASHTINIEMFLSNGYIFRNISTDEKGNFYNTKLNIVGSVENLNEEKKKLFYDLIKQGKLNGCYLNGKLITGLEYVQGTYVRKNDNYENLKQEYFDSITKSIEEQKKSFKSK